MQLSASEKRFIAACRKSDRTWPFLRWPILFMAVGSWLTSSYILFGLTTVGERAGIPPGFVALEVDVFCLVNLASALIRWRGDRRTTLLLKLVDLHENDGAQPNATPGGGPGAPVANSEISEGPPSAS